MNSEFLKFLKAAFLCAAFLFNIVAKASEIAFESVKQNAIELLLQKKKSQAILLLTNYIKTSGESNKKIDASELLLKISKKFILKEAQEAYENSINLTLENAKEAGKSNDKCLSIEPQQLDCLVQKTRLLFRAKKNGDTAQAIVEIKELAPNSKFELWLDLMLIKNKIEFKNKQIIKKLPEKNDEESLGLILLELDRAFLAKNYSKAKDLMGYFEKNYSDWPDLFFYKYKLDLESSEEKQSVNPEARAERLLLYASKCKSLNKTTARKFRYDFDLCVREI